MASTTLRWPWPRLTLMRPDEKSRIRRSPAKSHDPCAPVITSGFWPRCIDHEISTCSTAMSPSLAARCATAGRASPGGHGSHRSVLVPAGGHLHDGLLEAGAIDVEVLRLERVRCLLRKVCPERAGGRLRLQHLVGRGDVHGLVPGGLVESADPVRRRPDQGVDLVELPGHVALAERGARLQDDVHALALVVAAEDPALERGLEELRRDVLVPGLREPGLPHEDVVLEHRRPDGVEVDDVQLTGLVELPGLGILLLEDLRVL